MATHNSDQFAEGYRKYPIDKHGKIRFAYFSITAPAGGYAADDLVKIAELPQGRKRLLPSMSRVTCSALGAGRTIDIGHEAYLNRAPDNDEVDADFDAFVDGMDVSSASADQKWSDELKYDLYSMAEIDVFLTLLGGTMPEGETIEGYVAYVCE